MPQEDTHSDRTDLEAAVRNALDNADEPNGYGDLPNTSVTEEDGVVYVRAREMRGNKRNVHKNQRAALDAAGLEWDLKDDARFSDGKNPRIVVVTGFADDHDADDDTAEADSMESLEALGEELEEGDPVEIQYEKPVDRWNTETETVEAEFARVNVKDGYGKKKVRMVATKGAAKYTVTAREPNTDHLTVFKRYTQSRRDNDRISEGGDVVVRSTGEDTPEGLADPDDVPAEVMDRVARRYGMGAGAVKGALAFDAPASESEVESEADEAALEARRIAAEDEEDDDPEVMTDGGVVTEDDDPVVTVQEGDVFKTALGKRLEIVDEDGDEVLVHHPGREPVDPDADRYTVWRLRRSVEAQVDYENMARIESTREEDEDPEPLGEFTDEAPPQCPRCGAFMDCREQDGMGLPTAVCTVAGCGGFMDDRELIDGGYFRTT